MGDSFSARVVCVICGYTRSETDVDRWLREAVDTTGDWVCSDECKDKHRLIEPGEGE